MGTKYLIVPFLLVLIASIWIKSRSPGHQSKSKRYRTGRATPIRSCKPGHILFLRHRDDISDEHFEDSGLDEGELCHPALVVKTRASSPHHVVICPLTSFNNNPGHVHLASQRQRWKRYLPIFPATPFEENDGIMLYMATKELFKPSYVKFRNAYAVHLEILESYGRRDPPGTYRLTDDGIYIVEHMMKRYRVSVPEFPGPKPMSLAKVPSYGRNGDSKVHTRDTRRSQEDSAPSHRPYMSSRTLKKGLGTQNRQRVTFEELLLQIGRIICVAALCYIVAIVLHDVFQRD